MPCHAIFEEVNKLLIKKKHQSTRRRTKRGKREEHRERERRGPTSRIWFTLHSF
jgi:hypothetical protein